MSNGNVIGWWLSLSRRCGKVSKWDKASMQEVHPSHIGSDQVSVLHRGYLETGSLLVAILTGGCREWGSHLADILTRGLEEVWD